MLRGIITKIRINISSSLRLLRNFNYKDLDVKTTFAKSVRVYKQEGVRGLFLRLKVRTASAKNIIANSSGGLHDATNPPLRQNNRALTVDELYEERFRNAKPLSVFLGPISQNKRLTLVTDSINSGSLFGGVGTAIIFGVLLAERLGAHLRVVTRIERPGSVALGAFLDLYGIRPQNEMEFAFASIHTPKASIDYFQNELFLTTSWWTTEATLTSIPAKQIIYLLQEDERMFYPGGDEHLRCSQLLSRPDIKFAINTEGLREHLIESGLTHLINNSVAFEPAFPCHVYSKRNCKTAGTKRRLFFYARPNHPRNLFYFGLKVLDTAIAHGIIDSEIWEIISVGNHIPKVKFCDGSEMLRSEGMSWQEYATLVGTIDVGLCLMYTPHPSYPPFDLASSQAVVVTNRFGNKSSLEQYCRNILCADLELNSLLHTLRQAMQLAQDESERMNRFEQSRINRSWETALAPTFDFFSRDLNV